MLPFIDYLNEVDDLLEARYGITCEDADLVSLAQSHEEGWKAVEFVEWLANKYDLTRIEHIA